MLGRKGTELVDSVCKLGHPRNDVLGLDVLDLHPTEIRISDSLSANAWAGSGPADYSGPDLKASYPEVYRDIPNRLDVRKQILTKAQ